MLAVLCDIIGVKLNNTYSIRDPFVSELKSIGLWSTPWSCAFASLSELLADLSKYINVVGWVL